MGVDAAACTETRAAPRPRRGTRAAAFLTSFGAAKLAVYLIPLGLAAKAPAEVYGAIEFAYAAGLLAVTILVGAPLHGMSHRHLMKDSETLRDEGRMLAAALLAVALGALLVAFLLRLPQAVLFTLAITGLTAFQVIVSFVLRALGRTLVLAWVDGLTPFAGLAGVLGCRAVLGAASGAGVISAFAAIDAFIFVWLAATFLRHRRERPEVAEAFRRSTAAGAAMALYAVLGTSIAVSGRVAIGFAAPKDLAAFGVAFRVAGLGFGVAQLALTGMWRRIYGAQPAQSDREIAGFTVAACAVAAFVLFAGAQFLHRVPLDAVRGASVARAVAMLPAVSVFVFYWAAHSMLQPLVNRFEAARPALAPLAAISAAFVLAVIPASASGGAPALAWLVAGYACACFWATWATLLRKGVRLTWIGAAALAGGILLLLLDAAA